ncbi:von Willebrand factor type A domain-containing protein [Fulvivirga sp.]|uniref:vWA domain-containing protein n=1 Tax=Fulvivirga sp. TaxID=1931237 RepID=UPI0032EEAADC
MKIKMILCLMLIGFMYNDAISQIRIAGKVTSIDDGSPLPGVTVAVKGTTIGTVTDIDGEFSINAPSANAILVFSFIGLATEEIKVGNRKIIDVQMSSDTNQLSEVVVVGYGTGKRSKNKAVAEYEMVADEAFSTRVSGAAISSYPQPMEETSNEDYAKIVENGFKNPFADPLSTFSIDVDAASYSNVRRFLNHGQMPPKDAVRIEEMVNYFNYDYKQPNGDDPFSINTELASSPWNKDHKLVHIGLQGKDIAMDNLPPSNLVFLLDVSGSMSDANKLPLLKSAFRLLIDKLRPQDKVAIVVYAGAAGEVLPSTSASEKDKILDALDNLSAGGSTAGGAGINLAYKIAKQNFVKNGNNRVILATDGDFNVGASSNESMEELIEQKREEGVFLTVLGFGMGNYKDSKMEILADKGNGNYAYIDNILEAQKVLVHEFGGTLFTIAKDVKIQVEFNPAKVQAYRLVGYENRILAPEDFNNDKKDAGELGAGHTVTALYEIIPVGVKSQFVVDDLKYQKTKITEGAISSSELMTVKLRYKAPDDDKSKLIVKTIEDSKKSIDNTSDNFRWSAAVAAFGMQLTASDFKGDLTYSDIYDLAKSARGKDEQGYRAEFIRMVESCRLMARK